eukprot:PhF_6_TR40183/c0_g1_i1/m.59601
MKHNQMITTVSCTTSALRSSVSLRSRLLSKWLRFFLCVISRTDGTCLISWWFCCHGSGWLLVVLGLPSPDCFVLDVYLCLSNERKDFKPSWSRSSRRSLHS